MVVRIYSFFHLRQCMSAVEVLLGAEGWVLDCYITPSLHERAVHAARANHRERAEAKAASMPETFAQNNSAHLTIYSLLLDQAWHE